MERRSTTHRERIRRTGLAVLAGLGITACQVEDPTADQALSVAMAAPVPAIEDIAYGPEVDQVLDVIRPIGRPSNRRAIVWLHGGGWIFGDENGLPPLLSSLVQEDGYTVFSVRYRLAGSAPYPAAVQDVDRAMRWIKVNGGEYAIDTKRLVSIGFSSGAHLALLQGLSESTFAASDLPPELGAVSPTPAGVVALAAPIDLLGFSGYTEGGRDMLLSFLGCTTIDTCDPELVRAASPATYADPTDPLVYAAQGDLDHVVPVGPTDALVTELETKLGFTRFWYDRVDTGEADVRSHDLDHGVNRRVLGVFIATVDQR